MVWDSFSEKGKGELVFVDGDLKSSKYCATLCISLLPFLHDAHPKGAVFQRDNEPCHTSAYSTEWLCDMEVDVPADRPNRPTRTQ